MKKVYQTKTGIRGNCFNACLASILEIPIDEIPETAFRSNTWLKEYQRFLKPFNLGINWVEPIASNRTFPGFTIGSFDRPDSKYKDATHAIVCWNGKKFHDPFPLNQKSGKIGKLIVWYVITILDPTKPVNIKIW